MALGTTKTALAGCTPVACTVDNRKMAFILTHCLFKAARCSLLKLKVKFVLQTLSLLCLREVLILFRFLSN